MRAFISSTLPIKNFLQLLLLEVQKLFCLPSPIESFFIQKSNLNNWNLASLKKMNLQLKIITPWK